MNIMQVWYKAITTKYNQPNVVDICLQNHIMFRSSLAFLPPNKLRVLIKKKKFYKKDGRTYEKPEQSIEEKSQLEKCS